MGERSGLGGILGLGKSRGGDGGNNDAQGHVEKDKSKKELASPIEWIRRVGDYFLVGSYTTNNKSDKKTLTVTTYSVEGDIIHSLSSEVNAYKHVKHLLPPNLPDYPIHKGEVGYEGHTILKNLSEDVQRIAEVTYPYTLPTSYVSGVRANLLFPEGFHFIDSYPTQEIAGGKFLVSPDKDKLFAIQVKNNDGHDLPQNQWVYFTLFNTRKELPKELRDWVESKNSNERLFSINDKYDGAVTSQGLTIFKVGSRSEVLFKDPSITDSQGNFITRAGNPSILYYIPHAQPTEIKRIALDDNPKEWKALSTPIPRDTIYPTISHLSLDPTGSFFVFESEGATQIVALDNLELAQTIPGAINPSIDSRWQLSTTNGKYLTFHDVNFESMAKERQATLQENILRNFNPAELFVTPQEKRAREAAERTVNLQQLIDTYGGEFIEKANTIRETGTLSDIAALDQGLKTLEGRLRVLMPDRNEDIKAILETIDLNIIEPLRAQLNFNEARSLFTRINAQLENPSSLSLSALTNLNQEYQALQNTANYLDAEQRTAIVKLGQDLERVTAEQIGTHTNEFISQANDIVIRVEREISEFTGKTQMDDWYDNRRHIIKRELGYLFENCPIQAVDAFAAIEKARQRIEQLVDAQLDKFNREYALFREKAFERTEAHARLIIDESHRLQERVRSKSFATRAEAEEFVRSSPDHQQILEDVEALKLKDPDKGQAIHKRIRADFANLYFVIDRNSGKEVSASGQQIVHFGDTAFPVWEGKVQQRQARKMDVQFIANSSSLGNRGDELVGDICIKITNSDGQEKTVRLFQELADEDQFRFGNREVRGAFISPSYLTNTEYKNFKKNLTDWDKGPERSLVQRGYWERRQRLRDIYATRPKVGEDRDRWDAEYRDEYEEALKAFADYVQEKHISLIKRVEQIRNQPDEKSFDAGGYIPEWQSHWVLDPQAEADLERMAQLLGMQLNLQEGLLLLKGHAGTGKDVLVKMFAEKTRRPYFSIDGTKWTTEFDLSEEIQLSAENGMPVTIKVPSAVLKAITTPGAILYFNELNGMSEQAQIFLHALLDEKRTLTLKASGKTVKADPSVLMIGSINPGYPGTFPLQMATRSRMVEMEIDYPPLTSNIDARDPNKKERPYNVSEALRIVRDIPSLADFSYEMDMSRNTFVKIWDQYVNRINSGAPALTTEQKFDLDVLVALVQFSNMLRQHFIATFERQLNTAGNEKTVPVKHPITTRELRRCAYTLGQIPAATKSSGALNVDKTARDLLGQFFFSHIDEASERSKAKGIIATKTSRIRLAA